MPQYKYNIYWLKVLNYSFPDVLPCCNNDNKEDSEVESIVVALLLSPSQVSESLVA